MEDADDDILAQLEAELAVSTTAATITTATTTAAPLPAAATHTAADATEMVDDASSPQAAVCAADTASKDELATLRGELQEARRLEDLLRKQNLDLRAKLQSTADATAPPPSSSSGAGVLSVFKRGGKKTAAAGVSNGDVPDARVVKALQDKNDALEAENARLRLAVRNMEAEIVLHKDTKDQLARQVKATQLDIDDQRRLFKASMAELSERNKELLVQLRLAKTSAGGTGSGGSSAPTAAVVSTPVTPAPVALAAAETDQATPESAHGAVDQSPACGPPTSTTAPAELPANAAPATEPAATTTSSPDLDASLAQELETLRTVLAETTQARDILVAQLQRHEEALKQEVTDTEGLRDQLRHLNSTISTLQDENQRLRGNVTSLQDEKDDAEKRLAACWQDLRSWEKTSQSRQLESQLQAGEMEVLQTEISELKKENAGLKTKVHESQTEISKLRNDIRIATDALHLRSAEHQGELNKLVTERNQLIRDAEAHLGLAGKQKAKATEVEAQNTKLTAQLKEAQKALAALEAEAAKLRDSHKKVLQFQEEEQALIKQLREKTDANEALQKENTLILASSQRCSTMLEQERSTFAQEKTSWEAERLKLAASVETLTSDRDSAKEELALLTATFASLKAELESQSGTLKLLEEENERLRSELASTTATLEQERADYKAETTYLTSQLNEELSQRGALEQKLADAQDEMRLLQKKNTAAMKDLIKQLQQAQRKAQNKADDGDVSIKQEMVRESQAHHLREHHADNHSNHESDIESIPLASLSRGKSESMISLASSRDDTAAASAATAAIAAVRSRAASQDDRATPSEDSEPNSSPMRDPAPALASRTTTLSGATSAPQHYQHHNGGNSHHPVSLGANNDMLGIPQSKVKNRLKFLEAHVRELTETIKAKNHLLQHYMLREKRGALAPVEESTPKEYKHPASGLLATLAARGHSGHAANVTAEANRKLQEVLEDALIKNMELTATVDALSQQLTRVTSPQS